MPTKKNDICIIGAGAAGMHLATALEKAGVKTLLLEAGDARFDFSTQKLGFFENCGEQIRQSQAPYTLDEIEESAPFCRMVGGTLNAWSQKCSLLDPIDFEKRKEIPFSGWPLSFDDLVPFYKKVGFESLLPTESVETLFHTKKREIRNITYSITPRVNSYVTKIHLRDNGEVDFVELSNKERISATFFVLACGTIENTRLLLASGLRKYSPWLGKNLLDHPKGIFALIDYDGSIPKNFSINEEILKELKLPNHRFELYQSPENPSKALAQIHLDQRPNKESTISLSEKTNTLGLPIAKVNWKLHENDYLTMKKFFKIFEKILGRAPRYLPNFKLQDASHQMGTTRMAKSVEEGVVDSNCKFFGVDNLYIAGSSIFPSGGCAHPTVTIIAFAERLAEHLKARLS